jgi:hypothetical protein
MLLKFANGGFVVPFQVGARYIYVIYSIQIRPSALTFSYSVGIKALLTWVKAAGEVNLIIHLHLLAR